MVDDMDYLRHAPVIVDESGGVTVPAFMWVLLDEFNRVRSVPNFSFSSMLLATVLFRVHLAEEGYRFSTSSRVETSFSDAVFKADELVVDGNVGFEPNSGGVFKPTSLGVNVPAYVPSIPFNVEDIDSLPAWPLGLFHKLHRVEVERFVSKFLWGLVVDCFGGVKQFKRGQVPDVAVKFLLDGAVWASVAVEDEQSADWFLLSKVLVNGVDRLADSVAVFPAWVYPVILYRNLELSWDTFVSLVTRTFMVEMVANGSMRWVCDRWVYQRAEHSLSMGASLLAGDSWDLWLDDWFKRKHALNYSGVSDVQQRLASKLLNLGVLFTSGGSFKKKFWGSLSGGFNTEALLWYERVNNVKDDVSLGDVGGVVPDSVKLALKVALSKPEAGKLVKDLLAGVDWDYHLDRFTCCGRVTWTMVERKRDEFSKRRDDFSARLVSFDAKWDEEKFKVESAAFKKLLEDREGLLKEIEGQISRMDEYFRRGSNGGV